MNDRLTMPSSLPAEYCELHSDRSADLTATEQAAIHARANEIISERLSDGPHFWDLLDYFDFTPVATHIQVAGVNSENAVNGDSIAQAIVSQAVFQIWNAILKEAELLWRTDAEKQAEKEITSCRL